MRPCHLRMRPAIELHLETSLAPAEFVKLLDRMPHPKLKVNYDSGNSSSLGYAPPTSSPHMATGSAAFTSRIGC